MRSFEAKKLIEQKKKQLWRIKTLYFPIYGILLFSSLVTLVVFLDLHFPSTRYIEAKDINWFLVFGGAIGGTIIGLITIKPFYYWDKKIITLEKEIRDISFWIR